MTKVAPYTGAWIEIMCCSGRKPTYGVAPYTGAWIEIDMQAAQNGWKSVAPYTGAWIEIVAFRGVCDGSASRSLHGSVD